MSQSPLIDEHRSLNEQLRAENETLRSENAHLGDKVAKLERLLEEMAKRLYGRSSERRVDDGQLCLFETGEKSVELPDVAPAPPLPRSGKRRINGLERGVFPSDLPRRVINIDPPAEDLCCDACERSLRRIGEDVVERLTRVTHPYEVNQYVVGKFACACKKGKVVQAPTPPALIERSRYEPIIHAHVSVSKFGDHLPLARQESIFRREGIHISRSTMWDMIFRAHELLLPILVQMKLELLREAYIQADDANIRVLIEGQKGAKNACFWVYRSGKKSVFEFTLQRNRDGPGTFLADWCGGILQGDGHSCFEGVEKRDEVLRIGCWAHARREFVKAEKAHAKHAAFFLRQFRRLWLIERILKERRDQQGLCDEEFHALRLEVRQRTSVRIAERIYAASKALSEVALPADALGGAFSYLDKQRERLMAVFSSGVPEIDNNASERDLRQVVLGRKNWLVTKADSGTAVAATFFSLIGTCKALGVNAVQYIAAVLERVGTTPRSEIATLTPWAWAEARENA